MECAVGEAALGQGAQELPHVAGGEVFRIVDRYPLHKAAQSVVIEFEGRLGPQRSFSGQQKVIISILNQAVTRHGGLRFVLNTSARLTHLLAEQGVERSNRSEGAGNSSRRVLGACDGLPR